MTLLFLFIGDIHIRLDNLSAIDVLEQKVAHLEQRPHAIVLAGDVLDSHERIHCQLLNRAYKLIHTLRHLAPVYILVGNHDYINNQQFLTSNHWMNALKCWGNVTVVDHPVLFHNFLMMPYVPVGRFIEALNTLDFDWRQTIRCIFAHQEMAGCKMGAITSLDGDVWQGTWPLLISGHIHEPQRLGSNLIYPGSCINHGFGHHHQGLALFSFDETSWTETILSLDLKKKRTIVVKQIDNTILDEDKLDEATKLIISVTREEIKKFRLSHRYKQLQHQQVKIVFKPIVDPTTSSSWTHLTPFETILFQWVREQDDPLLEQDLKDLLQG